MGSGSSSTKVQKVDKSIQIPSASPTKPSLFLSPSKSYEPLFKHISPQPNKRRTSFYEDVFELDPNIEDYSSIWDHDTKLSSTFQKSSKSNLNKIEHHQKEILNTKWNNKSSTNFDSAQVESSVDTQTHSCINLSSSEKIDELINSLNRIHAKLDDIIKNRTGQISTETESVLSHILNETQRKQQRLLNYAKEQQSKQDENYRKALQEYISHLDEIKAKDLSDLQNQLQIYREQILGESQLKIMTVNEQANIAKAKILRDEQQQAEEKINSIINQIQQITTDEKLQHLESELITKTNIITNANVGTKPPGQSCSFHLEQNDASQQRPQSNRKQIMTHIINEEEKIITPSTRRTSVIQRSKPQQ